MVTVLCIRWLSLTVVTEIYGIFHSLSLAIGLTIASLIPRLHSHTSFQAPFPYFIPGSVSRLHSRLRFQASFPGFVSRLRFQTPFPGFIPGSIPGSVPGSIPGSVPGPSQPPLFIACRQRERAWECSSCECSQLTLSLFYS